MRQFILSGKFEPVILRAGTSTRARLTEVYDLTKGFFLCAAVCRQILFEYLKHS